MKSVTIELEKVCYADHKTDFSEKRTPGEVLKAYRREANISRERAALEVGIDPSTLKRYENDEHLPRFRTVVALCIVLHVNINKAEHLMRLYNYAFGSNEENNLLRTLLCISFASDLTLEDCNKCLAERGFSPLTGE